MLNDLSSVNIFTGRNNTGKSSCLEAIALLASGNVSFKNSFKEDMLKFITFRRAHTDIAWNYLLRNKSNKAMIAGFKKINNKLQTSGIVIGKTLEDVGLDENDILVQNRESQFYRVVERGFEGRA